MLTVFTIPKAFTGHIGIIQRNAVKSWTLLGPDCEVFLCGNDPGTEETAHDLGTKFIPDIPRNEFGTPLLNATFDAVRKAAKNEILCYVNADIIFLSDLLDAVRRTARKMGQFLLVGQRWDVDITVPWNFDSAAWEEEIRSHVTTVGKPHAPTGSDYFVFRNQGKIGDLPPFAVGRPGWDCWLIYHARKLGVPVVDASKAVTVIHQNHDYRHVPEKSGKFDGRVWTGPEAEKHDQLIGNRLHYFDLQYATHVLTRWALLPAFDYTRLRSRWYALRILNPRIGPFWKVLDKITPTVLKRLIRLVLPRETHL
jgi:hypothetical protein